MIAALRSPILRVIAAIVIAGVLATAWSRHVAIQQRADNDARAQRLIHSLEQTLHAGSAESDVIAYLREHHPKFTTRDQEGALEYLLAIGEEPSQVWGCGSASVFVALVVERSHLVRTHTIRWELNCM